MNDLIQMIKILDDEELKIINSYIDQLDFQQNRVLGIKGLNSIDSSIRSSFGSSMNEDHDATKLLHIRINESLLVYKEIVSNINIMFQYYPIPGGYDTTSHRETIQTLEYHPNQEYKFHHDVSNNPNSKEYYRQISVIVYLNSEFEGGGTEFPHQIFKPPAGHGLIFPSNWCYPHSGQKVLSGKKRVAVTWYYITDHSA
jgi:hypothetical protein